MRNVSSISDKTITGCRKRPNATVLTSASTASGVVIVSRPETNAKITITQMSLLSARRSASNRCSGFFSPASATSDWDKVSADSTTTHRRVPSNPALRSSFAICRGLTMRTGRSSPGVERLSRRPVAINDCQVWPSSERRITATPSRARRTSCGTSPSITRQLRPRLCPVSTIQRHQPPSGMPK